MKTINKILLILTSTVLTLPLQAQTNANSNSNIPTQFNEATVAQLQAEMASGSLTSVPTDQLLHHTHPRAGPTRCRPRRQFDHRAQP